MPRSLNLRPLRPGAQRPQAAGWVLISPVRAVVVICFVAALVSRLVSAQAQYDDRQPMPAGTRLRVEARIPDRDRCVDGLASALQQLFDAITGAGGEVIWTGHWSLSSPRMGMGDERQPTEWAKRVRDLLRGECGKRWSDSRQIALPEIPADASPLELSNAWLYAPLVLSQPLQWKKGTEKGELLVVSAVLPTSAASPPTRPPVQANTAGQEPAGREHGSYYGTLVALCVLTILVVSTLVLQYRALKHVKKDANVAEAEARFVDDVRSLASALRQLGQQGFVDDVHYLASALRRWREQEESIQLRKASDAAVASRDLSPPSQTKAEAQRVDEGPRGGRGASAEEEAGLRQLNPKQGQGTYANSAFGAVQGSYTEGSESGRGTIGAQSRQPEPVSSTWQDISHKWCADHVDLMRFYRDAVARDDPEMFLERFDVQLCKMSEEGNTVSLSDCSREEADVWIVPESHRTGWLILSLDYQRARRASWMAGVPSVDEKRLSLAFDLLPGAEKGFVIEEPARVSLEGRVSINQRGAARVKRLA